MGITSTTGTSSLSSENATKRIAIVNTWTFNDLTSGEPAGTVKIRYQYSNHLGSASLELNDAGEFVSYQEYFPFGETAYTYGTVSTEYRFTGKERDSFTGLYYFGARYYAPWMFRWMNPDPSGPVDGLNVFVYVSNQPIVMVDPDGREKDDINKITEAFQKKKGLSKDYPLETEWQRKEALEWAKKTFAPNLTMNLLMTEIKRAQKCKTFIDRGLIEGSLKDTTVSSQEKKAMETYLEETYYYRVDENDPTSITFEIGFLYNSKTNDFIEWTQRRPKSIDYNSPSISYDGELVPVSKLNTNKYDIIIHNHPSIKDALISGNVYLVIYLNDKNTPQINTKTDDGDYVHAREQRFQKYTKFVYVNKTDVWIKYCSYEKNGRIYNEKAIVNGPKIKDIEEKIKKLDEADAKLEKEMEVQMKQAAKKVFNFFFD